MEDKAKIVQMLLPVIQATRNGSDVAGMYYQLEEHGRETVYIQNKDGTTFGCNVSLDSGTAMIRDICAALQ